MTLGDSLRQARENSRLSIEDLSASTNIRIGLLLEMESNNFSHCGGDTYARGHLRNIATKIGANGEELINLYNEEHSIEHRAIHDLLVENNVARMPRESKKISWKIPAALSIAILVAVGIVQIVASNLGGTPETKSTPTAVATADESATPTPVATTSPTASPSPSTSPSHGPVSLVLSAVRGNSYIDIVVDGKHVDQGSIFQGDTKSFKGKNVISIYLSNPAGIDVTFNGKLLAPLGGENQEVRRTFR